MEKLTSLSLNRTPIGYGDPGETSYSVFMDIDSIFRSIINFETKKNPVRPPLTQKLSPEKYSIQCQEIATNLN